MPSHHVRTIQHLKGYHGLGCGCFSYDGTPPAGAIYFSL